MVTRPIMAGRATRSSTPGVDVAAPTGHTLLVADHLLDLDVAWQQWVAPRRDHLESLLGRHRERHRTYHDAVHVLHVVRHVEELADEEPVDDRGAIVAAAFYHDAVYEPRSPANERASARLARRDLADLGWTTERAERVALMIEGTATHLDPPDLDSSVLFDADLAILGAEPARYAEYVTGVRAEYHHVDEADWVSGRTKVLTGFTERPSIYCTDTGRRRWESPARANIAAEIAQLTGRDAE